MPIATRVAHHGEEAVESFLIRRKKTWKQCQEDGIIMRREEDVPSTEWDRIHAEWNEEPPKVAEVRPVRRQIRICSGLTR